MNTDRLESFSTIKQNILDVTELKPSGRGTSSSGHQLNTGILDGTPCFVKLCNGRHLELLIHEATIYNLFRNRDIPYVVPFLGAGRVKSADRFGVATEFLNTSPLCEPGNPNTVWQTTTGDKLTAIEQFAFLLARASEHNIGGNDLEGKNVMWLPYQRQIRAFDLESWFYLANQNEFVRAAKEITIPGFVGFVLGVFGIDPFYFNKKVTALGKDPSKFSYVNPTTQFLDFDEGLPSSLAALLLEIVKGNIHNLNQLKIDLHQTIRSITSEEIIRVDDARN